VLSSRQFGQLSGELRSKGGFSVNIHTGERPTSGIMVSDLQGERSMPLRGTTGAHIQAYAEENKGKRLRGPNRYLGGWAQRDVRPQQAVLDRSTRYPDTPLGRSKGYVRMVANVQKAAYDVGKDSYIQNPARQGTADVGIEKIMRRMRGENVA
jgi:hypothetical protein